MLTVGIQGGVASFHSIVCHKYFTDPVNIIEFDNFTELSTELKKGSLDFAVMAIENKIAGILEDNYKLIVQNNLHIIAELILNIRLYLMAFEETEIEHLTSFQSHPVALKQCKQFFKQHPKIPVVEIEDTANGAARIYNEKDMKTGVIASLAAAKLFGLNILTRNIAGDINNHTRFYILSKQEQYTETVDKLIVIGPKPIQKIGLADISIMNEIELEKNQYLSEFEIDDNDFAHITKQINSADQFKLMGALKIENMVYEDD